MPFLMTEKHATLKSFLFLFFLCFYKIIISIKLKISFSTFTQTEKKFFPLQHVTADRISARLEITLSREVKSYLLENYLPSTLFTVISWGSFLIIPTIVPGQWESFPYLNFRRGWSTLDFWIFLILIEYSIKLRIK